MATRAAHKRLTREYANLQKSPPDYIIARPAEDNILEWHYILTGPPDTPYHNGQYWGTLTFPPEYPFAPPAIRMHTPSGRFRPSERLCLTISDFHPKEFNPAWGLSTILLGVLSYMTGVEIATGSFLSSPADRKALAQQTRWWNSTGGGSTSKTIEDGKRSQKGAGAIKAGDGGKKFREMFPDLDAENWKWMKFENINPQTGKKVKKAPAKPVSSAQDVAEASNRRADMAVDGQAEGQANRGWLSKNRLWVVCGGLFVYVLIARVVRDQQ